MTRDSSSAPRRRCAWQFLFRAGAVITRLTLLLIVDVRGVAFYVAWTLIVVALANEAAATLVYRLRSWRGVSALGLAQAPSVAAARALTLRRGFLSASATGRP